ILKPDAVDSLLSLRSVLALAVGRIGLLTQLLESRHLVVTQLSSSGVTHIRAVLSFLNQAADFRSVETKTLNQGGNRRLQKVFRIGHNLSGINNQIVNLFTLGNVGTVPVHNIPSPVGNHPAVILLLPLSQYNFVVLLVVVFYNPIKNPD